MYNGKVLVIGTGRVGLPLLAYLISKDVNAVGVDINPPAKNLFGCITIAPFKEKGLQELLNTKKVFVNTYDYYAGFIPFNTIIITVGTPIDKNHNPDTSQIEACLDSLLNAKMITNETLLILRSTLFPGASEWIAGLLEKTGLTPSIVFAPERIAEGYALEELYSIPQPVGGLSKQCLQRGIDFFTPIVKEVIPMSSARAAEFVKLFSNGYRYVNFALANEFAMRTAEMGVDYNEVRNAVNTNYVRGGLAKAALNVGGYCLAKDWCLLDHKSTVPSLVKKAYEVAEKTPVFFANKYKDKIYYNNVGILGLAFKPGSDNLTDSLSYKMIKICEQYEARQVMVYDPYVQHPKSKSLDEILEKCNVIFVMTEHIQFKDIKPKYSWQIIIRL